MIEVRGLTKVFRAGGMDRIAALDAVDLTIPDGQLVTIIGSNGAGKSTLLNAIAGVFPCDAGTVRIGGVDVGRLQEHQRASLVARVFQNPLDGTAGALTVEQNLTIALLRGKRRRLAPATTAARRELFQQGLRWLGLGLEERLRTRVQFLSGGQRQALTLLMAVLSQPSVLLLDEHTAALDPVSASQVLRLTELLVHDHGLTTLMVTHNMGQALRLGQRTIMMDRGRVVLDFEGEERQGLTIGDLVQRFYAVRGEELQDDELLLQHADHWPAGPLAAARGAGRGSE
jgi:putative ABC transport system ATP-binding protein